ncbi:MAG TPA: hypothetical protein VE093_10530 [Polyangiaceae bacterium]|jgi:hypothetical protein|nr:hypothetical protein [Polyangiaceae bacterium]
MAEKPGDRFTIPLPGGRVARVPVDLLEQFIDPGAKMAHSPPQQTEDDDVTAHNESIDPTTGASAFHTEWELGYCEYTDESGFPRTAYVWHRHPMGNAYTEIYQR